MSEGMLNDILIVDDDHAIVELLVSALGDVGYQCFAVYDGESALFAIGTVRPALVLLDLNLPGLTGADVVTELRRSGLSHVPIILMTADAAAAALLPATNFPELVFKPFTVATLLECVARYLSPREDQEKLAG
jgi:DNA-binding response OmpR family regulator